MRVERWDKPNLRLMFNIPLSATREENLGEDIEGRWGQQPPVPVGYDGKGGILSTIGNQAGNRGQAISGERGGQRLEFQSCHGL